MFRQAVPVSNCMRLEGIFEVGKVNMHDELEGLVMVQHIVASNASLHNNHKRLKKKCRFAFNLDKIKTAPFSIFSRAFLISA